MTAAYPIAQATTGFRPFAAGLAGAFAMALALPAAASEPKTVPGFDWLAKAQPSESVARPIAAPPRVIGTGSWVCSASGFGRESRCVPSGLAGKWDTASF